MTNNLVGMGTPALLKAAGKEIDRTRRLLDDARHRRATPDNLIQLGTDLRAAHRAIERAQAFWAVAAANEGHSWAAIGDAMDISRQGARQRFLKFIEDNKLNGV